jgi:hypothetical protein
LHVKDAWAFLASEGSYVPSLEEIGTDIGGEPYLQAWQDFDYVLVLYHDYSAVLPTAMVGAKLVADEGFAAVYQTKTEK